MMLPVLVRSHRTNRRPKRASRRVSGAIPDRAFGILDRSCSFFVMAPALRWAYATIDD